MAKKEYIVNSAGTLTACVEKLYEHYGTGTFLKVTVSDGRKASMSQKALVHIWLREYAAHLQRKPVKDVTETEIEGLKYFSKRECYLETHESWLTEVITDPFHADKKKRTVTSMADWLPHQMTFFMSWLQARAANQGLTLESTGEYKKARQQG